ncbi:MAG: biotin--[acetyl-CoA-carboxylase] ligase [Prevotellaceae bacterium]|jgi:BirA family biotin operon repressor/biotin-[acetyl-CoA-carboxylase] ligase|nr:biotin--[acetyl-CoA-carboxylase] ligase [Prevotellaceae bacterium]
MEHLTTVDSTNNYLKNLANKHILPNGYCVCADFQTSGRGQTDSSWESAKGENLLFSVYFETGKIPLNEQFLLSEIVSVSIGNALKKYVPDVKIKWANDIFVRDKKLAGILIETVIQNNKMKYAIVGVGLNVNQLEFVQNRTTAISLRQILGRRLDHDKLLTELLTELNSLYENFEIGKKCSLENEYFKLLYRTDNFYEYSSDDEIFRAKIVSVDSDGCLNLLTDKNFIRKFYFKQVKFQVAF